MARKKTTPDQAMLDAVREKAAASETKELELKNGVVLPKKELELKNGTLLAEELKKIKAEPGGTQVSVGRVPGRFEEQLRQELKKRNEELEKENKTLQTNLRNLTEERDQLQAAYNELKKTQSASSDSLQREALKLKTDNEALQKELNLVKGRLSASFTSQELANYLNEAITDFNSKIGQSSDTIDYAIGNMDVGLKAQIVKQNDKLGFITTSTEGEAAVSEIRFSITATPRA